MLPEPKSVELSCVVGAHCSIVFRGLELVVLHTGFLRVEMVRFKLRLQSPRFLCVVYFSVHLHTIHSLCSFQLHSTRPAGLSLAKSLIVAEQSVEISTSQLVLPRFSDPLPGCIFWRGERGREEGRRERGVRPPDRHPGPQKGAQGNAGNAEDFFPALGLSRFLC